MPTKIVALLTAVLFAALVLAGCSQAANTPDTTPPGTDTPQPEEPKEPTVVEQLQGTWRRVVESTDDEHNLIVDTAYLTFTKSRYIHAWTRSESSGAFVGRSYGSGTWRVEGDQIIKVRILNDVPTEIAKDFQVGPKSLYISPFDSIEPTDAIVKYERFSTEVPSIVGSWVSFDTEFSQHLTIVRGGIVEIVNYYPGWRSVWTANSWTLDRQEYVINFPSIWLQEFDKYGKALGDPLEVGYKRIAFAPTDRGIALSGLQGERDFVYGHYNVFLKRPE